MKIQLLEFTEYYLSPIGLLEIGASEKGLKYIHLTSGGKVNLTPNKHTSETKKQLNEYFEGIRKNFSIDLDLEGNTEFSIKVWNKLTQIPYGKTISYLQLAIDMGDQKCIRAAASANGRNPIPIIIPCHRVIGSDGSLTGYALGLEVKRKLLALENPIKYSDRQISLDL